MKYVNAEPETLSMTAQSDEPGPSSGAGPSSGNEPLSTALRRMHFKCGRILSSRLTNAPGTQSPIAIPKVILMGSSTTSETTLINNNTSTDSTGTMTTNFTTTTIEDSVDELTPIVRSSNGGLGLRRASGSISNNNNSQFNVFDIEDSGGSKPKHGNRTRNNSPGALSAATKTAKAAKAAAAAAATKTKTTISSSSSSSSTVQNNDFVRFLIDSKQNLLNVIDQITSGTSDPNNNRRAPASGPALSAAKKRSPFFRLTRQSSSLSSSLSSSSSSTSSSASASASPPLPLTQQAHTNACSSSATSNARSRSASPLKKREKIALLKRIDCLRDLFVVSSGVADATSGPQQQHRTKNGGSAESSGGDSSRASSKRPSLSSPSSWSAVSSRSAITPTAIHTPPLVNQPSQSQPQPHDLVDGERNYSIFDLLLLNGDADDRRNNNDNGDAVPVSRRKKRRVEYLSIPGQRQQRARQCSLPLTATDEQLYRLRNFVVTRKGIENRGDSFRSRRRRRFSNVSVPVSVSAASTPTLTPTPTSSTEHLHERGSRASLRRNRTGEVKAFGRDNEPCSELTKRAVDAYRVLVFGDRSVGKSSLVSQFQTSEYLHAYDASSTSDEDDDDDDDNDEEEDGEEDEDDEDDQVGSSDDDNNFGENGGAETTPDCESRIERGKKQRAASATSTCSSFVHKSISVQLNEHESDLTFINYFATDFERDWARTVAHFSSTFEHIHAFCLVFSIANRNSFHYVLETLQNLTANGRSLADKAVILVGNKCDLVRSRTVSTEEGRGAAETYNCKYIETSITISHNVDELLVGLLTQIRLKQTARSRVPKSRRNKSAQRVSRSTAASKKNLNLNFPGGLNLNLSFSRLLVGGGSGSSSDNVTRSQNQSPVRSPGARRALVPGADPSVCRLRSAPISATASFVRVRNFFERVLNLEPKSKSCENLHVL